MHVEHLPLKRNVAVALTVLVQEVVCKYRSQVSLPCWLDFLVLSFGRLVKAHSTFI